MSFFENASDIEISGNPQFNNVEGNFNQWNNNRHVHNVNSNNRTITNNTNSHNNNSVWQGPYPQNNPSARPRASQRSRGPAYPPQSGWGSDPDVYDDDDDEEEDDYPPTSSTSMPAAPHMPRWPGPGNPASGGHTRNIDSYNTTTQNNWDSYNNNSQRYYGREDIRPPRNPNQASTSSRNPPRRDPTPTAHVYDDQLRPPTLGEHHVKSNPDIALHTESQSGRLSPPDLVHSASAAPRPTQATFRPASPFNEPLRTELPPQHLAVPSTSQSHSSASTPAASPSPSSISLSVESETEQPRPSTSSNAPTHLQALFVTQPLPGRQRVATAGMLATERRMEAQQNIKNKLAKVSLSGMEDSSFFLREIATCATQTLTMIETIIGGDINKNLLELALESHAVTFIAIILSERRISDGINLSDTKKNVEDLEKMLDEIYSLVVKLRGRGSFKRVVARTRDTNEVQQFRSKLISWLRMFENDTNADIVESLKKALAENQVRRGTPLPGTSNNLISQSTLSPSSTHISDIGKSALSLGSGSAAVINGGSGNNKIMQNSHNNNSVNYFSSSGR